MPILTANEARAHCRLDDDYPIEQLQPYIDGAERHVIAYLNRSVFADLAALNAAQEALAEGLGQAYDARQSAIQAAESVENPAQRKAMIELAEKRYIDAQLQATRVMHGIVADGTIRAAMLLTLGNLFAHRETDVVGVSVAALPTGVPELLRAYRVEQMP